MMCQDGVGPRTYRDWWPDGFTDSGDRLDIAERAMWQTDRFVFRAAVEQWASDNQIEGREVIQWVDGNGYEPFGRKAWARPLRPDDV